MSDIYPVNVREALDAQILRFDPTVGGLVRYKGESREGVLRYDIQLGLWKLQGSAFPSGLNIAGEERALLVFLAKTKGGGF